MALSVLLRTDQVKPGGAAGDGLGEANERDLAIEAPRPRWQPDGRTADGRGIPAALSFWVPAGLRPPSQATL
jgi:hypothetical protein